MGVATTYRMPAMRGAPILPECIPPNPCRTSSTSTSRGSTRSIPPTRRSTACTFTTICSRTSAAPRLTRRSATSAASRAGWRRSIPTRLTDVERLERPALEASIRARLFELESVRTWERNPQHYGDLLSTSLAGQVLFDYAPLAERARRVLSKLRQVPRLMQAARDNIKDPPGIFVKVGLESLRGTLRFIEEDLPRAFGDARRSARARRSRRRLDRGVARDRRATSTYLEEELAPRARGPVPSRPRAAAAEAAARRRASRSTPIGCSRSPRASCTRRRRSSAARPSGSTASDPLARVGARSRRSIPRAGAGRLHRAGAARRARDVHPAPGSGQRCPASAKVQVAPTPRFYRWTFASMWTPGPVRDAPAARLLLHHRRRSVMAGRIARKSTCAISTSARSGRSRSTRSSPATSCTTSICASCRRRCASRSCSRRPRWSRAGRTTPSR